MWVTDRCSMQGRDQTLNSRFAGFTLAARTEAQIASASHRPTSAASATASSIHGLGEVVPQLKEAIGNAQVQFSEDAFAARVCLAEIHWLREEKDAVLETLAEDVYPSKEGGTHAPTLGWLEVCEAKAAYLRAATLQSGGKSDEARSAYSEVMRKAPGTRCAELRRWTERLLASGCMFINQQTTSPSIYTLGESLRCFQKWSDFWQRSPPPTTQASSAISHLDILRRRVWRTYFDLLSSILTYGLIYNPSSTGPSLLQTSEHLSDEQYTSAKSSQRAALKRVESTYESLLLNETQFPKASQTNTEVETFADQVMSNWKIFWGPNWADVELGDGGKDRVGHDVLDILYRAATKTFHSTAILRHLFTVHAALGEFDLAIHAWDSYEEIVSKGKARAEKTGKHEAGFDDDDTTVLTAVNAARVLCRYGAREQGEKAIEVAKVIRKWARLDSSADQNAKALKPTTLSAAYRMIGVTHGNQARLTYDSKARSGLRNEALSNFRQAMEIYESDLETAYDLAMVLAETRDIDRATTVLRRALSSQGTEDDDEDDDESSGFEREQKLVPIWHLLALCLTAKDEHEQAAKMCGAAFEQFGDAAVLFGEATTRSSMESEQSMSRLSRGLVDQMDGFQKENMLKVKMSQLILLELMEGAEVAVDVSHELLALYTRLFGNPEKLKSAAPAPPTGVSVPPSRGGGTLRSLAGSIRPKSTRQSLDKGTYANGSLASLPEGRTAERANGAEGANGAVGVPIAITVTNEKGEKAHDHRLPFKLRGHRGDWREHGNLKPSHSSTSLREKPVTGEKSEAIDHAPKTEKSKPIQPAIEQSRASDNSARPDQPIKEMAHNAPHDAWPLPVGHDDQPPRQDTRLPAPHPASTSPPMTRLSSAQERQHKISVLIEIWLFIAGLYLRASFPDDCSGAITEAHKLVELAEADAAAGNANARNLYEKSWGGGRSVDRLWADVWAAVSFPLISGSMVRH